MDFKFAHSTESFHNPVTPRFDTAAANVVLCEHLCSLKDHALLIPHRFELIMPLRVFPIGGFFAL